MLLENAKQVLNKLRSYGLRCNIAGGYARDVFFGLEPKDIDIIVYGVDDREAAVNAVLSTYANNHVKPARSKLLELSDDYLVVQAAQALMYDFKPGNDDIYVEGTYDLYHSKEDTDDQLVEVHKFNCGIDVLVYPPANNLFQALTWFDFNLNQFALVTPELQPEYLGTDSLATLVKTRLDPDDARIAYVEKKYAEMKPLIDKAIAQGRLF